LSLGLLCSPYNPPAALAFLQSLFEYLLIVTGPKAGVDASSPYASLAEALLDNVARKVGAVLEAGGADLASDASAGSPGGAAAPKGRRRSRGRRGGP